MRRLVLIGTALIAALSTAGCADITGAHKQVSGTSPTQAEGDETIMDYRPQLGFIRGTRPVLTGELSPIVGDGRGQAAAA